MLVTVESTGTLERRMRVELPAERIEKEIESRLKSVGRTAKIKAFARARFRRRSFDSVMADRSGRKFSPILCKRVIAMR